MADTIEQFTRNGSMRESWRDRFQNKWPYLTTLMYQTESDTLQKMKQQSKSLDSVDDPSWLESNSNSWTERNTIDIDEVTSSANSRNSRKRNRCGRTCSTILCVFLVLSVLAAVIAGIGLSILLSEYHPSESDHKDVLVDAYLTEKETTYLSSLLCNLVKNMLQKVEFPVEEGLETCLADLKYVLDSDGIHINMRLTPFTGYTIKEKFRRALRDEVMDAGATRPNCTNRSGGSDEVIETMTRTNDKIEIIANSSNSVVPISTSDDIGVQTFVKENTSTLQPSKSLSHDNVTSVKENIVSTPTKTVSVIMSQQVNHVTSDIGNKYSSQIRQTTNEVSKNAGQASIQPDSLQNKIIPTKSLYLHTLVFDSDDRGINMNNLNETQTPRKVSSVNSDLIQPSIAEIQPTVSTTSTPQLTSSILTLNSYKIHHTFTQSLTLDNTPTLITNISSHFDGVNSNITKDLSTFATTANSNIQSILIDRKLKEKLEVISRRKVASSAVPTITEDLSIIATITPSTTSSFTGSLISHTAFPFSLTTASNFSSNITNEPVNMNTLISTGDIKPTHLFQPIAAAVKANKAITLDDEASQTKPVDSKVENIMFGGVIKLPFKTNSNFKFLFSSDDILIPGNQSQSNEINTSRRNIKSDRRPTSKIVKNKTDQKHKTKPHPQKIVDVSSMDVSLLQDQTDMPPIFPQLADPISSIDNGFTHMSKDMAI